jgi:hypothetical protein
MTHWGPECLCRTARGSFRRGLSRFRIARPVATWRDLGTTRAWLRRSSMVLLRLRSCAGWAVWARHRSQSGEVDLLLWVTADTRDTIMASYARLAADLTGIDDPEIVEGAQRLLEWFAGTQARWLVVLDDLRHPQDLNGLWPAASSTGKVVVTTRRRDAALRGHRRNLIEVKEFEPDEAWAYLQLGLADRPRLLDDVPGLAAELGYLPLALAQATAYMIDRGLSCAGYRARFSQHQRRLASVLPDAEELPDGHPTTLALTWSLSIDLANRLQPTGVARPLLELASMLDGNGIPTDVFSAPAVLDLLTVRIGSEVVVEDAQDALGCLQRLSLMTLATSMSSDLVRVHALVQRATRDALDSDRLVVSAGAAAQALVQVWPEFERDTILSQLLRANTDALNRVGGEHLWKTGNWPVLFRAGQSLGDSGFGAEATNYFRSLHIAAEQWLGADHPYALTVRNELAYWRRQTGDLAGAVGALKELIADQARVLGCDHPDVLNTRHELARSVGESGNPAGAVVAFEDLLIEQVRVQGIDHLDTLNTRHSLAWWRGQAGDPAGAVTALEELLADRLRLLGSDHHSTLITRHDISHWRGQAGDPAGAVAALEQLLTDELRVLSANHPHILDVRHNLAWWRGQAGDHIGAVAELKRLLTDELRVLGANHPRILAVRYSLSYCTGGLNSDMST